MNALFAAVALYAITPAWEVPAATWQVAPKNSADGDIARFAPKLTKPRAALLIPGLYPHPIRPERALEPALQEWCEPTSPLVTALATDFDVYAFGYAQSLPLDAVSLGFGIRVSVERLHDAGYTEIVLIGHSAGGVIARQFVEHYPNAGITKIIQISAANQGSDLADLKIPLPKTQVSFIKSLAPQVRKDCEYRPVNKDVQFVCVVCKFPRLPNDLMVGLDSQWPQDLRKQGIPMSLLAVNHVDAPKTATSAAVIADLAREKLVRWTPEQTTAAERIVFSKDADAAATAPPVKKRERPLLKKLGDLLEQALDERLSKP